ncbi:MAG: acyl-CoA reductase, partial [Campylobacterota bacterium]|nr:acyl-CoA reductase [Campylobacterota bacterium]
SADVVSAWGSEEAIKSVRSMTPQGVRVVEWGHKISFAYFAKEHLSDTKAMRSVCEDICLLDQNACSSPQDVFIECDTFEALKNFAKDFASVLKEVASERPRATPESAQQAEISTVISVACTEQALGLTYVIEDDAHEWCVIADNRQGLSVSPLYRTIWIKPLPASQIVQTLHPMKSYLQTAALIAPKARVISFSHQLLGAGCLRIKSAGHMHDNYVGEPHDGVYALPSFMKRISLDLGKQMSGIGSFDTFETPFSKELTEQKIMDKTAFQSLEVSSDAIDLTFKSGGSSGKTTYAYYTYDDYHIQMNACASGLYSAGLDPKTDTVLNMFAAGHLYGGFLSFFSILEHLKVPQYPMGLVDDFESVGRFIVEKRINTLFSVPALLMAIFEHNSELFKKERVVKKLFFGGDHFTQPQIDHLQNEFGVEMIRAAAYGSNDAGPLGYQCPHCKNSEYHLLSKIQSLEVINLYEDKAIDKGEVGRLIFTSKQRSGQKIERYDVGDTGFLHVNDCPCGRKDPKFTLLGRSSDAFKAGGPFLHVDQFVTHLENGFNYTGLIQLLLEERGNTPILSLRLEPSIGADEATIIHYLKANFEDLIVTIDLGVTMEIEILTADKFEVVSHSGKVRHLIDKRNLG